MATAQRKCTEKPITAAQIRRIHTIISNLCVEDDNYRDALESRFSVRSCKDLSIQQAIMFIDELEKLAQDEHRKLRQNSAKTEEKKAEEQQPKRFDNLDNRNGMASGAQLRMIESIWGDVSIIPEDEPRARALRRFILKIAKVADMRFLDISGASKIIGALKAMQKREKSPEKSKTQK